MERVKRLSQRWFPRVYKIAQTLFYFVARLLETRMLGTKMQEWRWRMKTFGGDASLSDVHYTSHPHRAMLLATLDAWMPLDSILEIGCGRGDNLYLLGIQYPSVVLHGIDINARAVRAARQWLKQSGIKKSILTEGRADDLSRFSDKSIDIVFSDAVLLYVGPDKIKKALNEMTRIAKKAVILNEWHSDILPEPDPSRYLDAHWVHNYRALLAQIPSVKEIRIRPIPEEVWGGSGWKEYGSLVQARLDARQARLA